VSVYCSKEFSSAVRSENMSSDLLSNRVDLKDNHADCSVWLNFATVPSSIVVGKFCAASFPIRLRGKDFVSMQ
jgi:hypothetical protein